MTIEVLKPGMHSTLQDLGRYGYQRFGIVAGGAMDDWSHRIANALVGNEEDEATLELTLQGPSLKLHTDALIAVCGADLGATVGRDPLPLGRPVLLRGSAQLDFRRMQAGCRAYLAVRGGFMVPRVLGSRSTHVRASLGGLEGRALRKGDTLATAPYESGFYAALERMERAVAAPPWSVAMAVAEELPGPRRVRVTAGPQWAEFSSEVQAEFLGTPFRIGVHSDRMGFRLEAGTILPRRPLEMISEAVAFGTVQVPPDGNPIVLMADRQTTGGYPKIAQVASIDLPALAQMRPHERLRFEMISLDEAQRYYLERERELASIRQSIEMKRKQ
jgi:antagonist of KipI